MSNSPLSDAYIDKLAYDLLEPVKRGESAFIRWFPGHGKTVILSSIFSDKKIIRDKLGLFYKRFLFIRTDKYYFAPNGLQEYFEGILNELIEVFRKQNILIEKKFLHNKTLYPLIITIKKIIDICSLAIAEGYEIVFIVDAIDDIGDDILSHLFRAWEHIVESNRERIHTHINVVKLQILDLITQSGLIQNIIQIPLPDRNECQIFLNYYLKKWQFTLTDGELEKIFDHCGNDPVLLKEAIRLSKKRGKKPFDFAHEPTLLLKAKIDFGYYHPDERKLIEHKLKTDKIMSGHKIRAHEMVKLNFWNQRYKIPRLFELVPHFYDFKV